MTTDRAFATLPVLDTAPPGPTSNGQAAHGGPRHARTSTAAPYMARSAPVARPDATGRWLIAGACVLLAALAVSMGITSFHAQFTYIFATKREWAPAVLEALGLDAGAVTFALLGIALARLGRRAVVERVLVVTCALGSCGMNVLNANLASPRSVAVYGMPPILFALTSDRLIAVVRRAALGSTVVGDQQGSAWNFAGRAALYGLRLAVDLSGTARGLRQTILNATPLPQATQSDAACATSAGGLRRGEVATPPGSSPAVGAVDAPLAQGRYDHARSGYRRPRAGTKTARFLALVRDTHGPVAGLPLTGVYRISADLAADAGLHAGSARKALRAAILATRDGSR